MFSRTKAKMNTFIHCGVKACWVGGGVFIPLWNRRTVYACTWIHIALIQRFIYKHSFKANNVLFDKAVLLIGSVCVLILSVVCDWWKSSWFHLHLSIAVSFGGYMFAQGHYSSRTVSQPGRKKSSGEMRWLCSVRQKSSLLPVRPHTQSFLFYLASIISSPRTKTKPLPLTVSRGLWKNKGHSNTSAFTPDWAIPAAVQLDCRWISLCPLSQWN